MTEEGQGACRTPRAQTIHKILQECLEEGLNAHDAAVRLLDSKKVKSAGEAARILRRAGWDDPDSARGARPSGMGR